MQSVGDAFAEDGKTPLYFAADGKLLGIIAVADVIKEDSKEAIQELIGMGVQPVMLTGDDNRTAKAIGRQLGLTAIVSDVLPDGKEAVIRKIQESGSTAMVGDGINDAPALTRADIGIAIGAGADVAIDAADVVLMKSSLRDVAGAIRRSRQVIRNIHENLFWAFFYNVIGIPIAAGALIPRFGITLNPMFGAAAMSLSSFFVVSNALRLNLFDIRGKKRDSKFELAPLPDFLKGGAVSASEAAEMMRTEPCPVPAEALDNESAGELSARTEDNTVNTGIQPEINTENGGIEIMKVEVKVNGMMCQNCVKHVKKALEAMEGVDSAEVSLENNNAVVNITSWIPEAAFKAAIEEEGYEFVSAEAC
jgi:Cu2+-exporting ATPase